jgi:hypothetical protein
MAAENYQKKELLGLMATGGNKRKLLLLVRAPITDASVR